VCDYHIFFKYRIYWCTDRYTFISARRPSHFWRQGRPTFLNVAKIQIGTKANKAERGSQNRKPYTARTTRRRYRGKSLIARSPQIDPYTSLTVGSFWFAHHLNGESCQPLSNDLNSLPPTLNVCHTNAIWGSLRSSRRKRIHEFTYLELVSSETS
jgi:hypothetical protein